MGSEALLTIGECGAVLESKKGMMGKPIPGHEVDVVDTETAEPLKPGEVGEIAVRHERNPIIFNGYWNKPELTEGKFANEWLLTEDLGKKDEVGYISFQGRRTTPSSARATALARWNWKRRSRTMRRSQTLA
ncbi:AMP-binding protein [Halosolutus halophilus]|uniref:AMP-binding protein n=1 Tax=Halosolutus halophilus TaxID=1552990 RepID=UPI0022352EA0|nr:AMP-binding protein [Halosolutus halophilus]